jgi:hypothetical protein
MRDLGIPKLLTWRWAPCAALVLGSLSFVGFVTLAIPERIGGLVEGAGKASSLRLGNHLARARTGTPESPADFSGESGSDSTAAPRPVTHIAQHSGDNYPRRGFSPPLDRPAPPPAPPPIAVMPPPASSPVEAAPPPPATPVPPPAAEPAAPQPDLAQAAAAAPAPAGPPAAE